MVKIENRKRHALTNTLSADRVSRDAVMEPVGLCKFTSYIYQYATAGSSNIGPS